MIIQCTNCLAKFKFNEEKLKDGQSKKVRCSKCQQVFTVVLPEAVKARADQYELTKAKAVASRTPTGQMDGLNGNKRTKPDFAALNMPVKKKSKDNVPSSGKAFTTKSSDELSGVFGSLASDGKKVANTKTVKLTPTDLAPPAPKSMLSEVHHAVPAELSNMDFDSGRAADKPDTKEQHNINKEIYDNKKKTTTKPEYTTELMLLKEVSFDAEASGQTNTLAVEDTRIINDPAQLKKLKLEFKPQPLSGLQVGEYKGWSSMKRFTLSTVRFLLIIMILATLLAGSMMVYKGEDFNFYTFGLEGDSLDMIDFNTSE